MIDVNNLRGCTGCSACVNICARKAISMVNDSGGFLYPQVDRDKCTDCSLCNTVCQIEIKPDRCNTAEKKFYALVNKNDSYLKASSSGGAFLAVAEYVFARNGVVAGCAFDDDLKACHVLTYNMADCMEKLCGSKYVQSDTKNIYTEVRKCLSDGRIVLFVGTPCQIQGLYLFLKKKPDNLITLDLICHGVSSPLLWKKHKEYLEKQVRAKISKYRFRGKEKAGWALYYYYFYGDKNRCKAGPSVLDRYYTDFLKGANYRESCYDCKFSNLDRVGDITIGDFWGAQKFIEGIDVHKGVSLVIVNSQKGHEILGYVSDKVMLIETTEANGIEDNHNLVKPTSRPSDRDTYYQRCFDDFELWEKEYVETRFWKMAKIKSKIPFFIKKLLRK